MSAGVACALMVAEGTAHVARDGAFPYLNFFLADARYGVRLAPDAESRVRSRLGRVTSVTTNSLGFRGRQWPQAPARSRPRVLVLGDSQAMGLHVADADTFAAQLGPHGIEALDAGVPTWGPVEYLAILDELAPRVRPTHVAALLVVGNDWHEAGVPNWRRTTARDGWAIRPEVDAHRPATDFPGRSWLLGQSHLVHAARQLAGHASSVAPLRDDEPERLVRDLEWLGRAPAGFESRLGPFVRDLRDACARHGCEPIVLVLPLDVQVHAAEWAKYRVPPIDLRATEALTVALLADADRLGVRAVDLLPVLRQASPGAFLPDDPHLSPRGHAAIARAVAARVRPRQLEARR